MRAGGLDGDYVGIHGGNGLDDIVELGITHVRVDLGVVDHARGTQTEGSHRPLEIVLPLSLTQGQAFAQGGLVDLDHLDTGALEILHLVAQGKGDLLTGLGARLVVAHERPVEQCHRTGEHAFHGFVGETLGVAYPIHGHGTWTRYVAVDDGGLDAT